MAIGNKKPVRWPVPVYGFTISVRRATRDRRSGGLEAIGDKEGKGKVCYAWGKWTHGGLERCWSHCLPVVYQDDRKPDRRQDVQGTQPPGIGTDHLDGLPGDEDDDDDAPRAPKTHLVELGGKAALLEMLCCSVLDV